MMEYDLTLDEILKEGNENKRYVDNDSHDVWSVAYSFRVKGYILVNRIGFAIDLEYKHPEKLKFREKNSLRERNSDVN